MREEFEKWAQGKHSCDKDAKGEYKQPFTRCAWESWQACHQAATRAAVVKCVSITKNYSELAKRIDEDAVSIAAEMLELQFRAAYPEIDFEKG